MKLLLLDGNNVLIRSLMATERVSMSALGISTAALHVFINTLSRYVREVQPTHMLVAWDSPGTKNRSKLDPNYKANRKIFSEAQSEDFHTKKQDAFDLAVAFCFLANIQQKSVPGYEGDDIIAHYWNLHRRNAEVVIVSSDKDYMQLLTDGVIQIRLSSANTPTDVWDEARAAEHFDCPVEWIPNIMALTGDSGDNVIGIKGIGPKTAVKLLKESNGILNDVSDKRFIQNKNHIFTNYELVNLRDVSINDLPSVREFSPTMPGSEKYAEYITFLQDLNMKTALDKIAGGQLWFGGVY